MCVRMMTHIMTLIKFMHVRIEFVTILDPWEQFFMTTSITTFGMTCRSIVYGNFDT